MSNNELIAAKEFCVHHSISYTFIAELQQAGLVELVSIQEEQFIHNDHLEKLERLVRLHTDLDINPEGVEAIAHLLEKIEILQQEVKTLSQRLSRYE